MTPALILFDCDGTLTDSEYMNNLAVLETLKHFGVDAFDMEYALTHFVGLRFSKILSLASEATGAAFPENARDTYLQKVRELAKVHMKVVDGAKDVVELALRRGKACVVSNGEHHNVVNALKMVGLYELFDPSHIYTGLMAPNPKPAPDLFLTAASKMGFEPPQCLVIEDSVAGVTAGIAAGMETWGFCGTHHDQENHARKLLSIGAEKVFHDMADLKAALFK
jgi:HAD superfamily hydrolase (TIGR01509 family)